jgi:hypothetical protein
VVARATLSIVGCVPALAKIWANITDVQRYKRPALRCYQKHVISKVFGDCYYHAVKGHPSMSGAMVHPDKSDGDMARPERLRRETERCGGNVMDV